MIPSEVVEIADLMVPEGWRDSVIEEDVLKAAWRVHNAGFRKRTDGNDPRDGPAGGDLIQREAA